MKKILFIAEELDTNGAMFSLLALLKALPKDKYAISLFLFKHDGRMMNQMPDGARLLPESLPYLVHRMPLKHAIFKSVKAMRFDLVLYRFLVAIQRALRWNFHFWCFLPRIRESFDVACCYTDGFAAGMLDRKINATKKCSWIHLPYTICQQMPYVYDALKRMDMCVPVSVDTGRDLQKVMSVQVAQHIVHNITDAASCRQRSLEPCEIPHKEGVFRIVSVGRVTPQKFFEIVPSVATILNTKGLHYEWYIIGHGDKYDELVEETRSKGLECKVHFIGARNNPMPWIKSADVFVNPSRFEAWGMTVSEALCLGKAVIVSDIPVFREQITDGVNGLILKVTAENLAETILLLAKNETLRHQLERNAVNYPFTKEKIIKEFDELIEKLSK